MSFNKPMIVATYWISLKLILKSVRKLTPRFLISHTTVTLNEGQGQLSWYKNGELHNLYHHAKFERNRSINIGIQIDVKAFFFLFFFKSHKLGFQPKYCMDNINWAWGLSNQQVSTVDQILFNLYENSWDNWQRNFCFLASLWPLNQPLINVKVN